MKSFFHLCLTLAVAAVAFAADVPIVPYNTTGLAVDRISKLAVGPDGFWQSNAPAIKLAIGFTNALEPGTIILVNSRAELLTNPPPTSPRLGVVLADSGTNRYAGIYAFDPASTASASSIVGIPSANPSSGRWLKVSTTDAVVLPVAATPVLSPEPGTFTSTQSVTATSSTPGALIYYTSNGSTPTTNSTAYSGAINVPSTVTLRFVAWAPGYQESAAAGGTYTINLPPATSTVYWGNSALTTLTASQVQALGNSSAETDPQRSYAFASGAGQYKHFAWPDSFGAPRVTDGFFLAPFPVAMATPSEGASAGPQNGWYYQLVTISGVLYRHYWTFNTLGGALTINVQ